MPLLALLLLFWFALVALAWGDLLLRRCDPGIRGLQRFVLSQLLGLGLLGLLVFAIGWIGWTPLVAYGLLLLLTVPALARERWRTYRSKIPVLRERFRYWQGQLTRLDRALLVSLAVIFGSFFVLAFSPLLGWDATTHHYVLPKRYLEAGRIVPVPEIIFGNYPALIHNLYAWCFALLGYQLAGLLNWYAALLLAILLYSFGRTLHSRTAGLIAALAYFTAPILYWLATAGYIDLFLALYVGGALVAWFYPPREGETPASRALVPGLLMGLALGTKHLALLYLGALVAARLLTGQLKRPVWREACVACGIALLVASPWYIRSWIQSGNPIDPFLPGLFDPSYVPTNPISIRTWSQPTWDRGLWMLITWPWRLFTDFRLIDGWYRAWSPLLLALLPLPLLLRELRWRTPVGFLGWFLIVYGAIAFLLAPGNTRYALAAMLPLSWLTGMVGGELFLRPFWRLIAAPVLLGLPVLVMGGLLGKQLMENLPVYLDPGRTSAFIEENRPGYIVFEWANEHLPSDAKVLLIDPRAYFLERDLLVANPGNESHLAPPWTLNDTGDYLERLKPLGVTHIMLNDDPMIRPEGYYLYHLYWHAEREGITIQTPQQAVAWSGTYRTSAGERRPYMDLAEARRYMRISRVDILPDADGHGNPGAVVRAEWIRNVIGGFRTPLMQGHLAAMQPILDPVYDAGNMRIWRIAWERYDAGVALDADKALRWLWQGLPPPPGLLEEAARKEAALAGRIVPFQEYLHRHPGDF